MLDTLTAQWAALLADPTVVAICVAGAGTWAMRWLPFAQARRMQRPSQPVHPSAHQPAPHNAQGAWRQRLQQVLGAIGPAAITTLLTVSIMDLAKPAGSFAWSAQGVPAALRAVGPQWLALLCAVGLMVWLGRRGSGLATRTLLGAATFGLVLSGARLMAL